MVKVSSVRMGGLEASNGERARLLRWNPKFPTKHQQWAVKEGRYPLSLNEDGKCGTTRWSYVTMDRVTQEHSQGFPDRQEAIDDAIDAGFMVYDENNVKV